MKQVTSGPKFLSKFKFRKVFPCASIQIYIYIHPYVSVEYEWCPYKTDNFLFSVVFEIENTHVFSLAKGSVPSISLRSYMKQSIGLTCHADGWFPKPEVIWLDGQGQVRKEQSTTKMMMMPSGLYRVITSMNLKPGSDMEVSCRIVNNLLKTTSESRIQISGEWAQ